MKGLDTFSVTQIQVCHSNEERDLAKIKRKIVIIKKVASKLKQQLPSVTSEAEKDEYKKSPTPTTDLPINS